MEFLKKEHIKFRSKIKVGGREVDFIVGNYAIDIDGHLQDGEKNKMLLGLGYIPIHINNREIIKSKINIKQWQEVIISLR